MFSIIVAKDNNDNIGLNNKLIFHYKKDMENFKTITTNTKKEGNINAVIMGKNTFESIPNKFKPLKNRLNIIMSSTKHHINELNKKIIENNYRDTVVKSSIEEVLLYVKENKHIEHCFIIGGETIYNLFLEYNIVNNLYITIVNREFYGDTKFRISNLSNYKLIKCYDLLDKNILEDNPNDDLLTFNYYIYNNKEEHNYLKSIKYILSEGINKEDRTGVGTKSIFGQYFRYNVRNGIIPLFTTKKIFFRGVVEELLWFLSGSTNVKKLQEKNIHIWDGNSTREFLNSRGLYHLKEGDIGACFPADTIILTKNGYKNIQDVDIIDKLYTHNGNWCKINNLQKSKYNGNLYKIKIKYFSKPIKCTDNHPFLINSHNWCEAKDLKTTYLLGFKNNIKDIFPLFHHTNMSNLNVWFCMGFLFNKKLNTQNIKFYIPNKREHIINKFKELNIDIEDCGDSLFNINIDNFPILKELNNKIPEWLYDSPIIYINEFINGYYNANIYTKEDKKYVSISSYTQGLEFQRLYLKLNIFISIFEKYYIIKKIITDKYKDKLGYVWYPIEYIEYNNINNLTIYNFEVDTDNTYTVQNISVHNSYGHQLRHFNAPYINCETDYTGKGIDQIAYVLDLIKNDPNSRRILFSYWNPEQLKETALPSCFTKHMLVLTQNGYKEIQDITINDKVLTHKNRWKNILNLQKYKYTDYIYEIELLYNNKIIECTKEHPFYVRDIINNIDTKKIELSKPYWCSAEKINEKKHMLCFPINKKEILPKNINIKMTVDYVWYILGYFLNNGWISYEQNERIFYIKINRNHNNIEKILKSNFIFTITENNNKYYIIEISNKEWYDILEQFSNSNIEKIIPEWVQDAPIHFIQQFLKGYENANSIKDNNIVYRTKFKNIAYGLQRLYAKNNQLLYIKYNKININNYYYLWVDNHHNNENITLLDEYINYPIIKINKIYKETNVYNFEVSDDNSYIVNNTIVHNCHILYTFYVDTGKNEINLKFDQRSCDTFHGLPFNIASASLLLNMICYLTNYEPGEIFHTISDMHIYSSHIYQCNTIVNREPRIFPKLKLNPTGRLIKNIEDFTYEDFELINYYPHSSVKADMVV